jgi:DNA-directed RNA polymerase specialized sigma24 family protein
VDGVKQRPDGGLAVLEEQRPRLLGLAYRMLGSASEAEDVLAETCPRSWGAEQDEALKPTASLVKAVVNVCLAVLDTSRGRRESYVGPWLPEPVLTGPGAPGPLEAAERRESASLAWLALLERLTPAERAVFVLREAFSYRQAEIAVLLDLAEDSCRLLLRRARQRVGAPRTRLEISGEQRRHMVEVLVRAAEQGDPVALEELLAQDVVAWVDGGGTVTAPHRPVIGAEKVSRYVVGLVAKSPRGLELLLADVNGEPSAVAVLGTAVVGVLVPEFGPEGISALRNVVNPRKLEFLGRQWSRLSAVTASPL